MRINTAIPVVAFAAAALVLSGCTAEAPEPEPAPIEFPAGSTMADIVEAGTIRIGVTPSQPGLSALNLANEWEGFNVALDIYLASKLGLGADDIEWVNTTGANRIPFIEQDKIDVFGAAMAITPERLEAISMAGPYLETQPQLIVRKGDAKGVESLEDIRDGYKVCVLQGSLGQPRVSTEIPQAEIVEFNALTNCIRALEQGQVDAVDSSATILAGYVQEQPDEFEFLPMTYGTVEAWGYGVAKDASDLCEFLNEQMMTAFEDGTFDKLWADNMGDSGLAAPKPTSDLTSC